MLETITALREVRDEGEDPRREILDELGDLPGKLRVGGADVLVARYVRSGRVTSGRVAGSVGLLRPDDSKKNDEYQGCSGLVLKMGPLAYKTEKTLRWFADSDGQAMPPRVGDWVYIDPKLGQQFRLGTRIVQLIPDQYVFMVLDEPDIVA